jgi:hypothetical protein
MRGTGRRGKLSQRTPERGKGEIYQLKLRSTYSTEERGKSTERERRTCGGYSFSSS